MEGSLLAHRGADRLSRAQLAEILPPEATDTHKPIAHAQLVTSLIEGLDYRHIAVVKDEYAVTPDGMKLFGVMRISLKRDCDRRSRWYLTPRVRRREKVHGRC